MGLKCERGAVGAAVVYGKQECLGLKQLNVSVSMYNMQLLLICPITFVNRAINVRHNQTACSKASNRLLPGIYITSKRLVLGDLQMPLPVDFF